MKDLKIQMDSQTEVTLEDEHYYGSRAVLNVGYYGYDRWTAHDCYLTPKCVERMRDWLTTWLNEQKERKAKR